MAALPARLQTDLTEFVAEAGTGAGIYFGFRNTDAFAEGGNVLNPLLVSLGLGAAGLLGASQLSGVLASFSQGVGAAGGAFAGFFAAKAASGSGVRVGARRSSPVRRFTGMQRSSGGWAKGAGGAGSAAGVMARRASVLEI